MTEYNFKKVFTDDQEKAFVDYIKVRVKMAYGMTQLETRTAAYTFAMANEVNPPETWHQNRMAGEKRKKGKGNRNIRGVFLAHFLILGVEWLKQLRRRHPSLSLKKPEACSLSRATSFNQHNVKTFFENLKAATAKYPELGEGVNIYNLDETALTTVHSPSKVLADSGDRRLNKVVSAERGTLVTACLIIRADGTFLPPAMVFPRVNFKKHMINGAPVGTLGLANKSGWMNAELFFQVMEHFVKFSNSSPSRKSLLVFDNHESHLCPNVLRFGKENGVEILTLPPHCSDRMQPLDVSVNRSVKLHYNDAAASWMSAHPGQTITINQIGELFTSAFERALTPKNIKAGFRSCGIFPFDAAIFNDNDFMRCAVTDRPLLPEADNPGENTEEGGSVPQNLPTSSDGSLDFVLPEDCIPLPKAAPRKTTICRKKGKSMLRRLPRN